ncbi:MAG TPA: molybdopterin converting factor subunit 1 [Spirochaetota bacterium]|nr:molybdopterin converting factor subunit 1 [Spirochaetota bacterium]
MRIKIKVFASIRDICGFSEKELIVSDSIRVNEVIDLFIKGNQELSDKKDNLLIAVNEEYCRMDRTLDDGDTLAIFPPVSGG